MNTTRYTYTSAGDPSNLIVTIDSHIFNFPLFPVDKAYHDLVNGWLLTALGDAYEKGKKAGRKEVQDKLDEAMNL